MSMSIEKHKSMLQSNGTLVARILVGALFLMAGINKLMGGVGGPDGFESMIANIGLPFPLVVAWIVVLIEIVGGALLIVGYCFHRAVFLLAVFIVLTLIFVHNSFEDPSMMKNAAILGGLLYMLAYGPGNGWSMDKRNVEPRPSM